MEISGEDIKFIVMFIVIWGILLSVYEVLSLFEEKLKSMNKRNRGTIVMISGTFMGLLLTFLREANYIPRNVFLCAAGAIALYMITGIIDLVIYCFSTDER